jgi:pimeloyl-ACP methyl ester carboxylesterase
MYNFVLIHGSWHDGSAWDSVVKRLELRGHRAVAPTLAGHGKSASRTINHSECVESAVRFIMEHNLQDFVLVGHSFGGTIITKVAEAVPDRIRRLVFWNAFVPLDGNSLNDETPPHYRDMFSQLAAQAGDAGLMLPFNIWREAFINDADEDTARRTYAMLHPEPPRMFFDKLDLKKFYTLQIPRSYLNCTEDTALPPGEWGWHPRMSGRLGLYRLVQMPGSHEALFTNPEGLADKIIEAGRD